MIQVTYLQADSFLLGWPKFYPHDTYDETQAFRYTLSVQIASLKAFR